MRREAVALVAALVIAPLKILLDLGADPNAVATDGATPLHWAAGRGDGASIELLLAAGWTLSPTAPATCAASGGFVDSIKLLLARGAEVDARARGHYGKTPLFNAAEEGKLEGVRALLDAGACIECENDGTSTALIAAVASGNSAVVELMLARGAGVNHGQSDGTTPLHGAVGNGDLAVARLLLDHGADVTIRRTSVTTWQGTPLDIARRIGNEEMVALLQQYGAKE